MAAERVQAVQAVQEQFLRQLIPVARLACPLQGLASCAACLASRRNPA